MTESLPNATTPKRKRDPQASMLSRTMFSFEPPTQFKTRNMPVPGDGNNSPRSRVADKFRELALEGGGGVMSTSGAYKPHTAHSDNNAAALSPELAVFNGGSTAAQMDFDNEIGTRKRMRLPAFEQRIGLGHDAADPTMVHCLVDSIHAAEKSEVLQQADLDPDMMNADGVAGNGLLHKTCPSINRFSDCKSRSRRRGGSPPVSNRKGAFEARVEETVITDPIRAALTWHEDEITIYDPEDNDDDGTGINGIGFKPTPAIAHARAQKRRQQLAEYRKREESEARAKRHHKRREQTGEGSELEQKHSVVRVHFNDAEPTAVVMT